MDNPGNHFCIAPILRLAATLLAPAVALGQVAQGPSPFGIVNPGSYVADKLDTVNMDNGNDVIKIPLFSLPQLGKLRLSFSAISNITYWEVESGCTPDGTYCWNYYTVLQNEPLMTTLHWGAEAFNVGIGPYITNDEFPTFGEALVPTSSGPYNFEYVNWLMVSPDGGTSNLFYDSSNISLLRSADGSGHLLYTNVADPYNFNEQGNIASMTLVDSDGISTAMTETTTTQTDPNNNLITYTNTTGQGEGVITDTEGRTIPDVPSPTSGATTGCPNLAAQDPSNPSLQYQPVYGSSDWNVPGPNGGTSNYLVCFTQVSVHTDFWNNNGQELVNQGDNGTTTYSEASGSDLAIQSIVLPDGKSYWGFEYDASNPNDSSSLAYGTLTKLLLPQGGSIAYGYQNGATCSSVTPWLGSFPPTRVLASRTLTDINGHSETWTYTINSPAAPSSNVVTDPAGNDTVYTFQDGSFPPIPNCYDLEATRTVYQGSHSASSPVVLEATQTNYSTVAAPPPHVGGYYGYANALRTSATTTFNGSASMTSSTGYDTGTFTAVTPTCEIEADGSCPLAYGNAASLSLGMPTSTSTVDFTGSTLAQTTTHYQWQDGDSPYFAANILNTPETTTVLDGSNNQVASTTFMYDENDACGGSVKGHLTTNSRWNNTGSPVVTHNVWNCNGMITQEKDGNGNPTIISYDSSGIFPATVTEPSSNGVQHVDQYAWDFNTGSVLSHTDQNNVVGKYTYSDPFGRMTKLQNAYGTQYESDTTYSYPSALEVDMASDLNTKGDGILTSQTYYDGLGRVIMSHAPSGAFVRTAYDYFDQACAVSNPSYSDPGVLQCSANLNPQLSSPGGITYYGRDVLGRVGSLVHPDGTSQSWAYSGNVTTFTDELNNPWQRTSDALGRLTGVVEPGGQQTNYGHDALGNLLSVNQSGLSGETPRTRSFNYDSLSRLLCASNPENSPSVCPSTATSTYTPGTVGYTYDSNGNVLTKTDARNITTTSTYDALNRLTKKSYSDGVTPISLYVYDVENIEIGTQRFTTSNVVGRLSVICVDIPGTCQSMTAYSYDPMGRTSETLTNTPNFPTTGTVYAMTATYDLAGNRTSLTNSTGRTFNYSYDAGGRLQTASNTVGLDVNGTPTYVTTPMVSSMTYFPSGQSQTMTTNTGSATVTGTWGVDSRLRVTSYQNLSSANSSSTNYGYSLTYTPNSNVSTDAETVYNPASGATSWSWNFGYDSMNRLASAQSAGAVQFGCAWTYDSFGNRLDQEPSGSGLSCLSLSTPVNPNNQLSDPLYSYDASGDILAEGGNTLTYDGEGRILTVGATTYLYDAAGQRVSKITGGVETDYLRDPDGSLLDTYVGGSIFNQPQEMWVGGKHFGTVTVATGNTSQTEVFSLTNWLGSEAARTASTGIPTSGYVSQPFGDAQTSLFGSDTDDIHLTGKERDYESGNDYFGARYYASPMGRFMSPDPLLSSGVPSDPQTWNRYAYGMNNPLRVIDPTGLYGWDESAGGDMSDDDLSAIAGDKHNKQHKWAKNALSFRNNFRNAWSAASAGAGGMPMGEQTATLVGLNAYGFEGENNGVTVGMSANNSGAANPFTGDGTISVTFNPDILNQSSFLAATVAHEGVHVANYQAWENIGDPTAGALTHFTNEAAAWAVGSFVAQALGMRSLAPKGAGPGTECAQCEVWNKGWKAADVDVLRARGIQNILHYYGQKFGYDTESQTLSQELPR
jgi:RHS repeat-associated protein